VSSKFDAKKKQPSKPSNYSIKPVPPKCTATVVEMTTHNICNNEKLFINMIKKEGNISTTTEYQINIQEQ
jgi:hypothetical protein